jgi:hypothetical protein
MPEEEENPSARTAPSERPESTFPDWYTTLFAPTPANPWGWLHSGPLGSIFHHRPEMQRALFGESSGSILEILLKRQREQLESAAEAEDSMRKLSWRINEVLTQAALAFERIAKDQEISNRLKNETRVMLRKMRG